MFADIHVRNTPSTADFQWLTVELTLKVPKYLIYYYDIILFIILGGGATQLSILLSHIYGLWSNLS